MRAASLAVHGGKQTTGQVFMGGEGFGAEHRRPEGVDDITVRALGELSDALETAERARGHLYAFHQLTGRAHGKLAGAIDLLRKAGHAEQADMLRDDLLGRDVISGKWTFELVEEYDDGYHRCFRDLEERVRDELVGGRRHLLEAELKRRLQDASDGGSDGAG